MALVADLYIDQQRLRKIDSVFACAGKKIIVSNALPNVILIRKTLNFQANETQELEELKKSKEQTEARLNIQISSLNENLAAARTEAEKYQQQTKETENKLEEADKRNDDLKGEIAGEWHMVVL